MARRAAHAYFTEGCRKIIGIGRNYKLHAEELGNKVPEAPFWFLKPSSALLPNGGKILVPPGCTNLHYEIVSDRGCPQALCFSAWFERWQVFVDPACRSLRTVDGEVRVGERRDWEKMRYSRTNRQMGTDDMKLEKGEGQQHAN